MSNHNTDLLQFKTKTLKFEQVFVKQYLVRELTASNIYSVHAFFVTKYEMQV